MCLGQFDELVERGRIGDGNLAEHFAVECDVGFLQTGNEAAVIVVTCFAGSRDTGDPQSAIVAFDEFAVTGLVNTRADDSLLDCTPGTAAGTAIAFGLFEPANFGLATRGAFFARGMSNSSLVSRNGGDQLHADT